MLRLAGPYPERPADGITPTLSDAELLTLAVMSALLGSTSERRWLRYADSYLAGMSAVGQSGYNKRLRKASVLFIRVIRMLAMDTSLWSDDVWVVDSTPVECGRYRETARRSEAAGWAEYGYCASHSRYFWGLRLHLVCTLALLPVLFALASAKADEREILLDMLEAGRDVAEDHPGQVLIGDKNYFGRDFENDLTERELVLLRPARKGEARRAGQNLLKPLRQVIESVNWTFKGQLDLERPGGRTPEGIIARILARVLALTQRSTTKRPLSSLTQLIVTPLFSLVPDGSLLLLRQYGQAGLGKRAVAARPGQHLVRQGCDVVDRAAGAAAAFHRLACLHLGRRQPDVPVPAGQQHRRGAAGLGGDLSGCQPGSVALVHVPMLRDRT